MLLIAILFIEFFLSLVAAVIAACVCTVVKLHRLIKMAAIYI